jgi:hypothetical protein
MPLLAEAASFKGERFQARCGYFLLPGCGKKEKIRIPVAKGYKRRAFWCKGLMTQAEMTGPRRG